MRTNNNKYLGKQVGSYHIVEYLGSGGFADVYLGEHVYLKTQSAIKMLHIQLSRQALHNFLNEAKIIARLEHPNIIRVLDYGVQDGSPFLVMNYAPNGTLRQRYPHGTRLTLKQIVPYIQQAASALDYASQVKLIHRDVKPANMLIGQQQQLLLSDFGLALALSASDASIDISMVDSDSSARLQSEGSSGPGSLSDSSVANSTSGLPQKINTAGTISYMAPEQMQGKACYASDQYSLAIIAYEWISGECPFTGSFLKIASQHVLAAPLSLTAQVPDLPPEVEHVIFKALAKDPAQRFATVSDFAQALQRAAQTNIFLNRKTISSFDKEAVPQIQSYQNVAPLDLYTRTDVAKPATPSASASDTSIVSPDASTDVDTTYSTLKLPAQAEITYNTSRLPTTTGNAPKSFKLSSPPLKKATALPERRYKRNVHFTLLYTTIIVLLIGVISMGTIWYVNTHAPQQRGTHQKQPSLLYRSTQQANHTPGKILKHTPIEITPTSVPQGGNTLSTPIATPGSITNPQPVASPPGQVPQSTPIPTSIAVADCIQGSTSTMTFTAAFHGGDPAPIPFSLKNCGGDGSKNWQASVQSSGWLTLSLLSGSIDPGASIEMQVQASNNKLKFNTYYGSIVFTAGTSSWTIAITYTVVKP